MDTAYLKHLTDDQLAEQHRRETSRIAYWKREIKIKYEQHKSDSSEQMWLSEHETALYHVTKEIERRKTL